MKKYLDIAMYICVASIFIFFGFAMLVYPKELKCATAYYVAPQNIEKACAKLEIPE